jgi:hypothetical protein
VKSAFDVVSLSIPVRHFLIRASYSCSILDHGTLERCKLEIEYA